MKFLAVTLSAIAIWMGGHAVMQRAPVQVVIYVGDPVGAYNGTSDCGPCNRICKDLKQYKTDEGRFVVGTQQGAFFRLVKAPAGTATPTIVFPGKRPIVGYLGDHAGLIRKHPLAGRIKKR